MAGLQYSFFPTDFFYPRPSKAAASNLVSLRTPKRDAEEEDLERPPKSLALRSAPGSASTSIVSSNKMERKHAQSQSDDLA
ncbi:hypothetical protein NL676_016978 [Syzygium grande]|nr:hypothetical protein NL676_016978 [Syzygium grande]